MGNACQNPLIAGADSEEIIHKDAISPESYEDVVRGRQNKEAKDDIKHQPLAQDSDDEKPVLGKEKAEVVDSTQGADAPAANSQGAEAAASDATTAASSTQPEVPEQANLLSLETAAAGEAWADFENAPPAVAVQPQPAEASGIEWSDFSGASADPTSPRQPAAVSSTAVPAVDTTVTAAAVVEDLLLPSPAKKVSPPELDVAQAAPQPMQDLLLPDSPPSAAPPVVVPTASASEAAEVLDLSAAPAATIDLSAPSTSTQPTEPQVRAVLPEPSSPEATIDLSAPSTCAQPAEPQATASVSPAPVEVEARNPVEEAKTPKAVVTEATGAPKSPTQYFFIGDRQESLEAQAPLATEMRFSIDAVGEPVAVRTQPDEAVNNDAEPVATEPTAGADNRYAAFDEIAGSGAGLAAPSPPQMPAATAAIQQAVAEAVRPAATPLEASKVSPLVDVQELAKKIAETEAISRALPPTVITPAPTVPSSLAGQAPVLDAQSLGRLMLPAGGLNTMAAEQMISAMTPEQLMQMHGAVVEAFRMQTLQSRPMQTGTNEGENPLQEDDDSTAGLCKPEFGDLLPAFLEKNTISGLDSDGLKMQPTA